MISGTWDSHQEQLIAGAAPECAALQSSSGFYMSRAGMRGSTVNQSGIGENPELFIKFNFRCHDHIIRNEHDYETIYH
jgi:hypothetical protein